MFVLHVDPAVERLLPMSYLAVDFFFSLSGFVLAHAYAERLAAGMGIVDFMTRRYIRLAPLYLLGSAIGVVVAVNNGWPVLSTVIAAACAVMFLPKPTTHVVEDSLFPLNFPAWSLFFELVANLLFAAFGRRLSWRVLAALLATGAVLLMLTKLRYGDVGMGATIATIPAGLGRVTWSFFAGVAIYRIWKLRPAPVVSPLICGGLLVVMLLIDQEMLWLFLGFPLLIYLAASTEPKGAVATACSLLGVMSYGLYVLHMPVFQLLQQLGAPVGTPLATAILGVALTAVVLVLEGRFHRPVSRWLERQLRPLGAVVDRLGPPREERPGAHSL